MNYIDNLLDLYWSLGEYKIDDRRRMKVVVREISNMIRTWAPAEGSARICYLAVNEVADRLLRDMDDKEADPA